MGGIVFWTAAGVVVIVASQLLIAFWQFARGSQRSVDAEQRVREHATRLNEHQAWLSRHDVQLAQAESWREGFAAGARKVNHSG
jgi:hypothetical protein